MRYPLRPFSTADVEAAGSLLAAAHSRDHAIEPALPAAFELPDCAAAAVAAAWKRPGSSGLAAWSDRTMLAFMIGSTRSDDIRGRSAWVERAGHGLAAGAPAELYREIYAVLADSWVRAGHLAHYVVVPATDHATLDTWFSLGFGREQIYGCREIDPDRLPQSEADPSFEIRRAGMADLVALQAIVDTIMRYQAQSPIFARYLPELVPEFRAGLAELLADPAVVVWIAVRDGQILAYQVYESNPTDPADLFKPPASVSLVVGATLPSARGRGIGRRLTIAGLRDAAANGYRYCTTDWRSTNLLASRFWPRQGFRPVHLRLHRRIDDWVARTSGPA